MTRRVIYSDLDGTLGFYEREKQIEEVHTNPDGTVLVADVEADSIHKAHKVANQRYTVFFTERTLDLGRRITTTHDFVYVTGARRASLLARSHLLNFATSVIIENGGFILNGNYEPDLEWAYQLKDQTYLIEDLSCRLRSQGWRLDIEGRSSSLRVRKKDNPHKPYEEFKQLRSEIELPEGLQKTSNTGNLDIIPTKAGKLNAIKYLSRVKGYDRQNSTGIGDDVNDLEFLHWVKETFVLASSHESVLKRAAQEGWFISKHKHFRGIEQILRKIIIN